MPLYEFRLEAQDGSGRFRRGRINEPSLAKAEATLMLCEFQYVKFELSDERRAELEESHKLSDAEQKRLLADGWRALRDGHGKHLGPRDRAHVELHRQEKPYKLKRLKEIPGTEGAA